MRVKFLMLSVAVGISLLSLEGTNGRQTAMKLYVMLQQKVKIQAIKTKMLQHRLCPKVASKTLQGKIASSSLNSNT